jgi:anti-anti-sigma regulatory factor
LTRKVLKTLKLPSELAVTQVETLDQDLIHELNDNDDICLNITAVRSADTASIQLLCALQKHLLTLHNKIIWVGSNALSHAIKQLGLSDYLMTSLKEGLAQLAHNTRDLQENVMRIRMLPINFVFSASFALRMNHTCAINVREADQGDKLMAGCAYITPGGIHLSIIKRGARLYYELDDSEPVNRHKPSVDALFNSLVATGAKSIVAAILTGMGSDGAKGLLALRQGGAYTIAQDEFSSVV